MYVKNDHAGRYEPQRLDVMQVIGGGGAEPVPFVRIGSRNQTQLHLKKVSPNIPKHHTNWRLKAIEDACDPGAEGTHYSTVSSLSEKDFERLRHELTEVIQKYVQIIRDSPEETACCFNLDFFRLIRK